MFKSSDVIVCIKFINKMVNSVLINCEINLHVKLEAQWTEPVSLTFHSVLRKFYTEPSIGASYQVSVHLAKWFQRRRFKKIDRPKIRIAYDCHVC